MKGSQELIAYFNKREEDLGEKATKFNLFLEGYAEGYNDTKAIDETELAEVKKERDAYYDELLKLRQQKAEWMGKACEWITNWIFENAPHQVYDDFMSDIPELKKALEE